MIFPVVYALPSSSYIHRTISQVKQQTVSNVLPEEAQSTRLSASLTNLF
jgi:hypothetical protein